MIARQYRERELRRIADQISAILNEYDPIGEPCPFAGSRHELGRLTLHERN